MNNRTLVISAAAGMGALIVIGIIAAHHGVGTADGTDTGPVADGPAARELPGPTGTGSPSFPRAYSAAPAPETDSRVAELPQTRPTTRAVPGRPVRAAKFADVQGKDELTPQKVARVALSYVGADPLAEQVWEAAINSPNFTPDERKDLIEDLNEEGFDDPKNLTAADVPLILSRIQLIENLAPQAADEVNAAAFAEAYKDLVNMLGKLTK